MKFNERAKMTTYVIKANARPSMTTIVRIAWCTMWRMTSLASEFANPLPEYVHMHKSE